MILLFASIILFNFIAFKFSKRLSDNQIWHIVLFTIAFQVIFDLFMEYQYKAYWYFDKDVEWLGLLAHLFLIPPVNIIFIDFYPFKANLLKKSLYIALWTCFVVIYEFLSILPEPFGFFHLGWWKVWYDFIVAPILLVILLGYYKFILILEKRLLDSK
ncbi:hypothetical protein [Metabacillus schmidteae]|uniref:hypothetical protein n=1 Tax=Metabacillus schmidteae TaxID=2730405 RepID=UPI001588A7B8|nr:hypothetical protein [Metabacillus schmidteae]